MNNPLIDLLTPGARKILYAVYGLIGLAVGAIQVAYGAVSATTPGWFKIALAVYAFVGTAIGAVAASNVKQPAAAAPSAASAAPGTV